MKATNFLFFVDNAQQCFASTPQANFPAWIKSRLPFKISSTLKFVFFHKTAAVLLRQFKSPPKIGHLECKYQTFGVVGLKIVKNHQRRLWTILYATPTNK